MSIIDKNTRILILYNKLLLGKVVNKHTFCLEYEITKRTFDRDIENIRIYLMEECPYCELLYDRRRKKYYMTHTLGKTISGEESLLLTNMMLSKNYLRSDELQGILSSLINVTDSSRSELICKFSKRNKLNNSSESKNAVLKMHWDLAKCILNYEQIELEYEKSEKEIIRRKINPVELHFEGGHIYLIAYIVGKDYEMPAFYRLDRIYSFRLTNFNYSKEVFEKYRKLNIYRNLFNMLAGEKITVIIEGKINIKRVILDLFLDNRLIKEDEKYCIYEISAFKEGLMNWILSQKEKVKILEPESIRNEIIDSIKKMYELYTEKDVE